MSISANDFFQATAENGGSDSETNSDEGQEYYQPISAVDDVENDSDHEEIPIPADTNNGVVEAFAASLAHQNPNLHGFHNGHAQAERGISNLDLSQYVEEEEEEEEEEATMREASDLAISRAFREDESRRNAPLTPENALRIRNAMRRVSFEGIAPEWTRTVPEDRWIDQLTRLRHSSPQNN